MKELEEDGINYLVGSNAEDNWKVLDKCKQNWIWFHLDKLSSPYVVLMESKKNFKKEEYSYSWNHYLNYGANLCKENSKYKNQKVSVMWTEGKNVGKGNKIGSAIIKGKRNLIVL